MSKKDEKKPAFPSVFGSHKTMIDEELTKNFKAGASNPDHNVVLRDEHGVYSTELKRLDSGLADPNRYATSRLGRLLHKKKEKEE